jgi:acetyltransferase-like isoleucine patch superfamily enzyme
MRLSEKMALVRTIHKEGRPLFAAEELVSGTVRLKELPELGHKTAQKAPPYLFERNSAVHSPWTSPGPLERQYNFIGAHSYMNDGGYLRNFVMIGRYCSIGRRVTIGAGMHSVDGLSTSPVLPGRPRVQPGDPSLRLSQKRPAFTVFESDVWVGDGAIILPGVQVGLGSVIGANSVVTRDTVPYGVYAGAPARLIRRRFTDEICEALQATQWWDIPHAELVKMPLGNVPALLEILAAHVPAEIAFPETFACVEPPPA